MKRWQGSLFVILGIVFLFSLAYFNGGLTGKVIDTNYIDSSHSISNDIVSVLVNLYNLPSIDEFIFNWDGSDYSIYDDSLILMMNFEDDGVKYNFIVGSVEEGNVTLDFNGKNYTFIEEEKIDLDGDGNYDVKVSVNSINEAGQAELSIVIINEPVEYKEPISEEAWKEGYWIIVGVVILALIGVGLRFMLKRNKSKRKN